ncbi:MAG: hypothetical protein LBQ66_16855 [Planctomycetaceae bacterium]|nr:hypothetical protein [Planctomycetaceae bacterium]
MGNRPPGGYVGVLADSGSVKTHRQNQNAQCRRSRQRKVGNRPLGGCVFGERSKPKTVGAEHVSAKPKRPKRRAVWFCRCVSRSSCRLAPTLFTKKAWQSVAHLTVAVRFPPHWDEGKPRPYNVSVFWFWAIEIQMRFWRSGCRRVRRRNRLAVGYPPYVGGAFSFRWYGEYTAPTERRRVGIWQFGISTRFGDLYWRSRY